MRHWRMSAAAERRLLPNRRLRGPTPWVLAIMTFVSLVVAAAALALANGAQLVSAGIESGYSVQLAPGARADDAAVIIARLPGVAQAQPVSEAEMRRTLERWLGDAALGQDLPLPALIELQLAPGASRERVAADLAAHFPGAQLTGHELAVGPLLGAMRSLIWLAWGLVLLMAAATAAAVVLAARGALDTHRSTIEVMHGIGATDAQVAGLFQRRIAIDALVGSLIGASAAALVLLLIVGGNAPLVSELGGQSALGWKDVGLLTLLPLAGTVLAMLVARQAVLGSLRRVL